MNRFTLFITENNSKSLVGAKSYNVVNNVKLTKHVNEERCLSSWTRGAVPRYLHHMITLSTRIVIIVSAIVMILSLCVTIWALTRPPKGHEPPSKRFLHKNTEIISDYETVEVYTDLVNDNTCYFYYFADQREASAAACVAKPSSIY